MYRYLFLFLFLLVAVLSACKPQGDSISPEGAKQILQLRGYPLNAKGYFEAIRTEDMAAIRTFFQTDLDPNMTNEKGDTALTYGIDCCELKTIKALAEKVDLNGRNRAGDTALYLALKNDRYDIFNFLLERGADVNAPANRNYTVLHLAAATNDDETIKKLVDRGANVSAVNDVSGEIPLNQSCMGNPPQTETIKLFLEKGADINHRRTKDNSTCLMDAAEAGNKGLIQELLKLGADPKLKDTNGKTARDWALKAKHPDVAALLK